MRMCETLASPPHTVAVKAKSAGARPPGLEFHSCHLTAL